MAEVFLHDKSYVFTWVLSTPNIKIKHWGTMKGKNYKKFLRLVEISSTLQWLREVLLEKGHILQELLDVQYPGADAVCSAVGEIHHLLENQHDDICDVWVSAHVKVDDWKKSSRTEMFVRWVYYWSLAWTVRNMHVHNQSCLCLGDIVGNPQLRANVVRSFWA